MRTIKLARNRFSRFNQPVKCRGCGKLTTQNVNGAIGLDLCAHCQDEAGLENEHADGHHADEPNPNCIDCQNEHADGHDGKPNAACPDCKAAAEAR